MIKVFQVVKIEMQDEWSVVATRSTREKAENVVKNAIQPDLMSTVYYTIIESYTNATPKAEWDRD
ncbi:hypothetical protein M0R72_00580 [Candidatus Pacearchaeota archaeon]|jgi:hypothetical protein|nr:hypothetical protein [Candidatus Pacearchaeota archaeon]